MIKIVAEVILDHKITREMEGTWVLRDDGAPGCLLLGSLCGEKIDFYFVQVTLISFCLFIRRCRKERKGSLALGLVD